jgi:hypothetical protein
MSETRLPWLRLWTDIIDDEKLGLLAFEDRWHYVAILCMKRRGILDAGDSADLRDRKVGRKLGLGDADRDALRNRLLEVRLIADDWQPIGWQKRQAASDVDATAIERQRRHRERSRNGAVTRDPSVTNGAVTRDPSVTNGHVTRDPSDGHVTRDPSVTNGHVTRDPSVTNGHVTRESLVSHADVTRLELESESESESESEKNKNPPPTPPLAGGVSGCADAWRDVTECDPQAYQAWLDYREEAGDAVPPTVRIQHAKFLGGKGSPEQQRDFVAELIRRQFKRLHDPFHREGDSTRGPQKRRDPRDESREPPDALAVARRKGLID